MFSSNVFPVCFLFPLILFSRASGETTDQPDETLTDDVNFPIKTIHQVLKYSDNRTFTVNENISYYFAYPVYEHENGMDPPRISIGSPDATSMYPILVTVSQRETIMAWTLPLKMKKSNLTYPDTSRTLCVEDKVNSSSKQEVALLLNVGSASPTNVTFNLCVEKQTDFNVNLGEERQINITASDPKFYFFKFNDTVESVVLKVESEDDACMTLSIQNKSCPVHDLEETIAQKGFYQTLTKKGGIVLLSYLYPNGLYIVFNVHGDDSACFSSTIQSLSSQNTAYATDRKKRIRFTVEQNLSHDEFIVASTGVIVVFLVIYAAVGLLLVVRKSYRRKTPTTAESGHKSQNSHQMNETALSTAPLNAAPPNQQNGDESSIDQKTIDILRMNRYLCVTDLARQPPKKLETRSQLYFWNVATIAVFYSLPVVQLVYTNQRILNISGNQDLCYYNFLCSNKYLEISDFNHVFSNISYIFFGFLFMFLTRRKEASHDLNSEKGIPSHFGLAYAMGIALIMEGVMSACYHICPSQSNIQFDTTFMYIITILCTLKIYQTRHPDINASAYATCFAFACVIFIGMYGILNASTAFYVIFTVLHLLTVVYLSLQVYYMGHWTLGAHHFKQTVTAFSRDPSDRSRYFNAMFPHRLKILIAGNIFNWILEYVLWMGAKDNFSSFLLTIFMANLGFYMIYYICMKIANGETIKRTPLIYLLLSVVCWAGAGYFYLNNSMDWRWTPAISRTYNQPCVLFKFYDNHDIWHVLSAAGLFVSFMALLTLDDDLQNTERSKIAVF